MMRTAVVLIVLGLAVGVTGCGLLDALFWRSTLSVDELCAKFAEMEAKEQGCGLDTSELRAVQCAGASCFHQQRDGCDREWANVIDCMFELDVDGACPAGGETRFCEGAEEEYRVCRGRPLESCDLNGGNCPPSDGQCNSGEDACPDCQCPPSDGVCDGNEGFACPDCSCAPPDGFCDGSESACLDCTCGVPNNRCDGEASECPDCSCPTPDGFCDVGESGCVDCRCPAADGRCTGGEESCPDCTCTAPDGACAPEEVSCVDCACTTNGTCDGGEPSFCPDCSCPPADGVCDGAESLLCPDCAGSTTTPCVGDFDCGVDENCSGFCAADATLCASPASTCRQDCTATSCPAPDACVLFAGLRSCEEATCNTTDECIGSGLCVEPINGRTGVPGLCFPTCVPTSCPAPGVAGPCGGCEAFGDEGGCIPVRDGVDLVGFACVPVARRAIGDTCSNADDCVPGALCETGVCRAVCVPPAGPPSCTAPFACSGLAGSTDVGVCVP